MATNLRKEKQKIPASISPMLATLVDKPFDEEGWLYEVKWDGYRAIAYLNNGDIEIHSRNNKSFDEKFYPVHEALKAWNINAVVDGEIIVLNENGVSNFSNLQSWRSEADGTLAYYVFDILWLNGNNLMNLPLTKRKEILQSLISNSSIIKISESFENGAVQFFEAAKKMDLEGIIAKKADSIYLPGIRSKEWLKIKIGKRQEVVIGGYTNNEGSNKLFSALLVGVYKNNMFEYTGKIGTGFSQKLQKDLLEKFKPLIIKECPFSFEPDINKPSRFRPNPPKAIATWLSPKLVCEVSFAEMTSDNVMRHPSFEGLREDKSAAEVKLEKEKSTKKILKTADKLSEKNKVRMSENKTLTKKLLQAPAKTERKTLLNPTEKSQTRNVNGHDITFNNLDKIYYPKTKQTKAVSKRDVINYYYQIAPYILPYMKNRPQTLIRYPNGIEGESFYQKDVTGKVPDWTKQFPYSSEAGGKRNFLVCTDEASLLLIASLGGLEMHPWSSTIEKPDYPDWCIIDLDPSEKTTFEQVIIAAQTFKQILDEINVLSYCKTSGATGIHIFIPLGATYTYEQSKEFGRVLTRIAQAQMPEFTSIERIIEKRKDKMYLDFLQNRPHATLAAPYSLRPKPGATVSMPLHWHEVKKGLRMNQFNIFNAVERVKGNGDIFSGVLKKGINMKTAIKNIIKKYGEQSLHSSIQL